jgi:hypothetical protein
MKKEEVINKVNESAGSLFTKEDVLKLILSIEETKTNIDLNELTERIEAIIDEADDSEIEINSRRCEFRIENGNEIYLDEVSFETDSWKDGIKHEITQLIEATERGEACQLEEEVA